MQKNNYGEIANIYIAYEINKNYNISSFATLENTLFGAVSLTKNNNIDEYKYSAYGIGFARKGKVLLGNGFGRNCVISKDFPVGNMKKTGLNGSVYDCSVDYDAIAVDDILDIHEHLMKKNGIV